MSAETARLAGRIGRRSRWGSVYGFGSVFAKALRDSRRAILAAGVGLGLLIFFVASQVAIQFPTEADRRALAALSTDLPSAIAALLGNPINVDRLGGFVSWRSLNFMPIIVGLWSVVALSGTIATEAARGSLDLLATTRVGRVRLALEKAGAHVVGLAIALLVAGLIVWLAGLLFARLPGDEIGLVEALSHMLWIGLVSLAGGALAFAVAPLVGRSAAAGLGAGAMLAAFVVNNYASLVPIFESVRGLSWFAWTVGHRPLAGVSDPGSLAGVALLDFALLTTGVVVFVRRDIGITIRLASLAVPGLRLGLGGPLTRSLVDRLPAAVSWGLFIGLWGFVFGASASAFAKAFDDVPGISRIVGQFFPGLDFHTAAGVLQLVFFSFGSLVAGLAAAILVSGWSSDERDRRLEVILASPLSRGRWVLAGGGGLLGSIAAMTFLIGVLVAAGAAIDGDDAVKPFVGSLVLGLYAGGLAGVGVAIGGLAGPGLAAGAVGGLAVGFFMLDVLGPALQLPELVRDLSLSSHLGQPIIGAFDLAGIGACLILAVGGVVVGAWGLGRRDVGS